MSTNSAGNRLHKPGMDLKDRLDLYREQYYFELERKDRITSSLSFPSGLAAVLVGAFGYLLTQTGQVPSGAFRVAFAYVVTAMFMALSLTVLCLMMAYRDHRYGYLPDARQIERYWNDLVQHRTDTVSGTSGPEELFLGGLVDRCCEAHARTAESNKLRTHWRTMANRSLMLAIALAFAAASLSRWSEVARLVAEIQRFWSAVY